MILHLVIVTALVTHGFCDLACPTDWTPYAGSKCLIKMGPANFDVAKESCDSMSGNLVMIDSDEKNEAVVDLFGNKSFAAWMGIIDEDEDGTFAFIDTTPMSNYQPWFDGKPNDGVDNSCGEIVGTNTTVWWTNLACSSSLDYVCERDAFESCPSGWLHNKKDSVCVKVMKRERKTFNGARKYCQEMKGDLATKLDRPIQITQVMKTIKFRSHFWIGLQDADKNGVFEYIDGMSLDNVTAPLKPAEPCDESNEHCMTFKMRHWYPKRCNRKFHFICQKPAVTVEETPNPSNLGQDAAFEPIHNLSVPLTIAIQGGMAPGKVIFISGIPKQNASRFRINMLCGPDGRYDYALHLDARFKYGNYRNTLVMNDKQWNRWGTQELETDNFPFSIGTPFQMTIRIEPDSFEIDVDDQHYVQFDHRTQPFNRASHIYIAGDVTLTDIRFQ